jgi:predicted alpha/beta hydrolase
MTSPEILSITSADGHQYDAALYKSHSENGPVLVFYPALGTPSRVYRSFASTMAEHGVAVCTPDWRGIASSSLRASRKIDFGYRHLVEFDGPSLLEKLKFRSPDARIWLGGHSLGGQISALIAAANHTDICGLLPIASGSVFLPCFPPKSRRQIQFIGLLIRTIVPLLGHFPGDRIGFGGREAVSVMRDWYRVAATGGYAPHGSAIDYEQVLGQLHIPVLSLNFASDTFAPAAAADYLTGKLSSCAREKWLWTQADSEGIAFDHYSWLRNANVVAPRVAAWMHQHA